jgi:hypothetical protein
MTDEPFLIADPDCGRCDPLAMAHGVVASLALALDVRCAGRMPSRGEQRQRRALGELAHALALVFPHRRDADFMQRAVPPLLAMMRRADRRERYGAPHLELLPQAEPLPSGRLRIDLPHLCLAATMRLKQALEKIVARHPDRRRVRQLKAVVQLEDGLRQMAADLVGHRVTAAEAAAKTDSLFWAADDAIDNDLPAIFEEAERIGAVPRRAA